MINNLKNEIKNFLNHIQPIIYHDKFYIIQI